MEVANDRPAAALRALQLQGLTGVWAEGLRQGGVWSQLAPELRDSLSEAARLQLATHLLQRQGADRAALALEAAGVPFVFFKGLHLQEVLYEPPSLRPMGDIDVLVPIERRSEALRALASSGFAGRPRPGHGVARDRPTGARGGAGRSLGHLPARPDRVPMGPGTARRAAAVGSLWVPDGRPRRVAAPGPPGGDGARDATAESGRGPGPVGADPDGTVGRGAGAPASHRACDGGLGHVPVDAGLARDASARWFLEAVAPGAARRAYLRAWLRADPAATFRRHPTLVRGGFALAVGDGPGDVVRALRALARYTARGGPGCASVSAAQEAPGASGAAR